MLRVEKKWRVRLVGPGLPLQAQEPLGTWCSGHKHRFLSKEFPHCFSHLLFSSLVFPTPENLKAMSRDLFL